MIRKSFMHFQRLKTFETLESERKFPGIISSEAVFFPIGGFVVVGNFWSFDGY